MTFWDSWNAGYYSTVDSPKHKLKQLVDDDGTPNTDKNTVFKGYIVSKKSLLFVQGRGGGTI